MRGYFGARLFYDLGRRSFHQTDLISRRTSLSYHIAMTTTLFHVFSGASHVAIQYATEHF